MWKCQKITGVDSVRESSLKEEQMNLNPLIRNTDGFAHLAIRSLQIWGEFSEELHWTKDEYGRQSPFLQRKKKKSKDSSSIMSGSSGQQ